MSEKFSPTLRLGDLSDFIAPSQACIVSLKGSKKPIEKKRDRPQVRFSKLSPNIYLLRFEFHCFLQLVTFRFLFHCQSNNYITLAYVCIFPQLKLFFSVLILLFKVMITPKEQMEAVKISLKDCLACRLVLSLSYCS